MRSKRIQYASWKEDGKGEETNKVLEPEAYDEEKSVLKITASTHYFSSSLSFSPCLKTLGHESDPPLPRLRKNLSDWAGILVTPVPSPR